MGSTNTSHVEVSNNNSVLHDQVIFAYPTYNFGGPFGNVSYPTFYQHSKAKASEIWREWLAGSTLEKKKRVLKLILMTKDECETLRKWIFYHGEMLGFENLYVLDGSTEASCIEFLVSARDQWSVNVVFTNSTLNEINHDLDFVLSTVRTSCDMIMKFDTDEFLAVRKGENYTCFNSFDASGSIPFDCTLSPFGVVEYLNSPDFELTGERIIAGYDTRTIPHRESCSELGNLRQLSVQPSHLKAILDSRTAIKFDLGGHVGAFLPPFKNSEFHNSNSLGIIHTHRRCLSIEVKNCRKALQGHAFLNENTTVQEAIQLITEKYFGGDDPCSVSNPRDMKKVQKGLKSKTKAHCYVRYLKCPQIFTRQFFNGESSGKINPDFRLFLRNVVEKYSSKVEKL